MKEFDSLGLFGAGILLTCLLGAVIVGIAFTTNDHPYGNLAENPMPTEAVDLKLLGHGWYSFKLTAGGKDRQFLMHRSEGQGHVAESLVEPR